MTYTYRPASSHMNPAIHDETESLELTSIQRDAPVMSPTLARRQQSETEPLERIAIRQDTSPMSPFSAGTQQPEKEKSDSDSSNYLFVYFTQYKDKL